MTRPYNSYHPLFCELGEISLELTNAIEAAIESKSNFVNQNEAVIWKTACTVAAPILISFAQWQHSKLIESGFDKVYFLSRDGQIMEKVFNILFPGFSTQYLFVSRQSLLFPTLNQINEDSLSWILARTARLTLKIILARLQIRESELINKVFAPISHLRGPRQLSQLDLELLAEFFKSLEFESYIRPRINSARGTLVKYLHQEGIFASLKIAVTDVGWSGSLQKSLLSALPGLRADGFYIGVKRTQVAECDGTMNGFLLNPGGSTSHLPNVYLIPIIEVFCNATHASVSGYEESECGPVVPKFLGQPPASEVWPVAIQQEAILAVAKQCKQRQLDFNLVPKTNLNQFIGKILSKLLKQPSRQEAVAYGAFPDAEDQNESYSFPLAKSYSAREVIRVIYSDYKRHHNEWQEGCIKLSSMPAQLLYRLGKGIHEKTRSKPQFLGT